jgi:Flp pilus assembly protein TadD
MDFIGGWCGQIDAHLGAEDARAQPDPGGALDTGQRRGGALRWAMAFARAAPIPATPARSYWRTPLFAALVIAAAALAAYHNSFAVPFVFDDEPSILANPSIHSLWSAWSPPVNGGITVAGRPLLNFSLALNYAASGTNPWSYHALNLVIHIAAGLLLFGVVRRTLLRPPLAARFSGHAFELALLSAALWTLHPLQTESVTYVVQRAESLAGLWFLLTLWCFIRASEPGASRWWVRGTFVVCLAGMATKETMATAPLIVLLYDRTFVGGSLRAAWRERRGLHLALVATWLVLGWLVAGTGSRGGTFALTDARAWWRYDLTQFVAVVRYLRLAVWPHPLALDYGTFWIGRPPDIAAHVVVVVALLVATGVALVRWPRWGFMGAWFFVILAPSSLPPGTIQMIVEHRMYLPLAAIVVAAVVVADALVGRRSFALLAAVAVAGGVTAAARNQDYATAIHLFEDTVAKRPGNARAMALLADYERRAGRLDDARQWLERSLAVEPGVAAVLSNLGDVWQELGEPGKAVSCFQQALALSPQDAPTMNNLGNALILSGHAAEGIVQLEAALRIAPASTETRANLANALAQGGRLSEAANNFETLLQGHPDDAEAHDRYGSVLLALGRVGEAIAQLETAVQLRPDNADMHNRLGTALGRAGRLREALEQFQAALRLNPAHESARQNAALAQRRLGGG